MKDELSKTRDQVSALQRDLDHLRESHTKLVDEHKSQKEDGQNKDLTITNLKDNLVAVRKIAKKYKTQCEDQIKELQTVREQSEQRSIDDAASAERQEQVIADNRSELEGRLQQLETGHAGQIAELNQQIATINEDNNKLRR